jgi:hypothetical protein
LLCRDFGYKPSEVEALEDVGLPLRIAQWRQLKEAAIAEETHGIRGLTRAQYDFLKQFRQVRI